MGILLSSDKDDKESKDNKVNNEVKEPPITAIEQKPKIEANHLDTLTHIEPSFFDRNKTFKPLAKNKSGKRDALHQTVKASLKATLQGAAEMRDSVKLPPGENVDEWLAVHCVHFYNAASMVYGTCSEYCTEESCPIMSAGHNFEYLWADNKNYRKPVKVSAPAYIDLLFNWIDEQLSDPDLFPVDEGVPFPSNFNKVVKNIFKRLFRLYAHIYFSHFEAAKRIGAEAHLNSCFKHIVFFIYEFDLVDEKEMEPLKKLINKGNHTPCKYKD